MVEARGEELHRVVETRLRAIDQRYTAGRRAVVDLLEAAGQPVSIEDIGEALPELPRSSAYRHLVDLPSASVVRRVTAADEWTRFELAEDLTGHHHHLVCEGCGVVTDFTPPPGLEQAVDRHLDAVAAEAGFAAHGHRIDVLGRCAACR